MSLQKIDVEFLRENPLPLPEKEGDKQERGRVLVIAGSAEIPGAALLSALGALRAGAGILQIATCRSVAPQLGMAMPEAMVVGCRETPNGGIDAADAERLTELAAECDAVLIGPGMVDPPAVARLTHALLHSGQRPAFVLDALAFTCLRDCPLSKTNGNIVATPHAGEMANFLAVSRDLISAKPLDFAVRASALINGVVALKGAKTHIASPQGGAWLCDHGSIALATSGSGDTLAGILAGLLARGAPPVLATQWAVYAHGEAGRRLARHGTYGVLAREIPGEIPNILQELAR
jgi:hydroxyethylthiazole kinase-like uncharacterized protein yjeF